MAINNRALYELVQNLMSYLKKATDLLSDEYIFLLQQITKTEPMSKLCSDVTIRNGIKYRNWNTPISYSNVLFIPIQENLPWLVESGLRD